MIETILAGGAGVAAAAGIVELLGERRPRRRHGLFVPLISRLGAALGMRAANGLASRVAAAGLDREPGEVVALQAGLAVIAGVLALPLVTAAPGRLGIVILLVAPAAGYLLPEYRLRKRATRRRKAIEAELPDVLDLLRVAIAAGLAPRRALAEVGRRHPGTLAQELKRAAARTTLGESADRALDQLEARCPAPGIPAFVAALRRAERHGAPLASALKAQAEEARSRRAAQRSEQAAKAAPKIQLIVALMLVPAVLLLVAAAMLPAFTG